MDVTIRHVPSASDRREDGPNAIRDDNWPDREYHSDTQRHDDNVHFAVVGGMLSVVPAIEHLGDRRGQANRNDGGNRKSSTASTRSRGASSIGAIVRPPREQKPSSSPGL